MNGKVISFEKRFFIKVEDGVVDRNVVAIDVIYEEFIL